MIMHIPKSKSAVFLVEGHDEIAFTNAVKRYGRPFPCNLWEVRNVSTKLTSIPKSTEEIYIIYDTDEETTNATRFIQNVERLINTFKKAKIYLLQQTFNFEDEMVKGFSLDNKDELVEKFGAVSIGEFKSKFLKITALFDRLKRDGFNISKIWRKPIINELSSLNSVSRIAESHDYHAFRPELILGS